MKAVIIKEFGSTDVLELTEVSKPQPKSNEVLISIHSSGLNPADYKIRNGDLAEVFPSPFPRILGGDLSGIIEQVGEGVGDFEVGDEVFAAAPLNANGSYAEFIALDASIVAKKPQNISLTKAASLSVVGLTSIQALRDIGKLKNGDKVLIHAGSGGVGSFAIQYAKHLGATVYTTTSAKNTDYVKSLGADVVIDYTKEDFVEVAKKDGGMDMVFETIGGEEHYLKSIEAAKEGVAVPCIVSPPSEKVVAAAKAKNIKADFLLLQLLKNDLETVAKLVETEVVKSTVSKEFDLSKVKEAHLAMESGKTVGKMVLNISQ